MPYGFFTKGTDVVLTAKVPDALLNKGGGGTLRVTWPFYNPQLWSLTSALNNADDTMKLSRVSDNTFVVERVDSLPFSEEKGCWQMIAGDGPQKFRSASCPGASADSPQIEDNSMVLVVTLKKPTSKALLVSPGGGVYHLTIPDQDDKKKDGPATITLGQNDATWVTMTIPSGKVVARVETNGKELTHRQDTIARAEGKDDEGSTIQVEVTRDLTAKPGNLTITAFDADGHKLTEQKVSITFNWNQRESK